MIKVFFYYYYLYRNFLIFSFLYRQVSVPMNYIGTFSDFTFQLCEIKHILGNYITLNKQVTTLSVLLGINHR